jgi:hypothetical protein
VLVLLTAQNLTNEQWNAQGIAWRSDKVRGDAFVGPIGHAVSVMRAGE